MPPKIKTIDELAGEVLALTGSFDALKAAHASSKADFQKVVDDLKEQAKTQLVELMQKIPAAQPSAIHGASGAQVDARFYSDLNAAEKLKTAQAVQEIFRSSVKNPTDVARVKALGIDTGAGGAFALPTTVSAEILRMSSYKGVIRPVARVMSGVGLNGSIPKQTGRSAWSIKQSNVETTESTNPTLGDIIWQLAKATWLQKMDNSLLRWSPINFLAFLMDVASDDLARFEDDKYTNGDGSGEPQGFRLMSGHTANTLLGTNLTYDDLSDLKLDLDQFYRSRAVWQMSNAALKLCCKLKGENGQPIFLDKSELGNASRPLPDQILGLLLGKPVFENTNIPENLGTGTDETEIWILDMMAAYLVADSGSIEFATTNEGAGTFEKDQTAVRGITFLDGKCGQGAAAAMISNVK